MDGFRLDKVYSYSLPFKKPLLVGGETLNTRDGLIIRVIRADGTVGYGEIAPLPGYSYETLAQARNQLRQLAGLSPNQLYPSVAFGLETALIKSVAGGRETVGVNALSIPGPDVEKQVRGLVEEGYTTIKMKVGRGSVDEDIEIVNKVLQALPAGIGLRLDANRNWGKEQALRFGRGVEQPVAGAIQYIEEPVKDISAIPLFYRQTGIGAALDESLQGLTPVPAAIPEGVCALVLKPTMIGGTGNTMSWIQLAGSMGLKVVISSCFEAGPGFAALLELASSVAGPETASGLDTLKYLEQTLFIEPLEIKNGRINTECLRRIRGKEFEELFDTGKLTGEGES